MTVIDAAGRTRRTATATATPAAGLSPHEKIDVCRGLFAALVVMAHAQEIAFGVHPGAKEALGPVARPFLTSVLGSGTYYVMGFFVLSGYCIQLSASRSTAAARFPVKRYTAARLSRILPLYYLGLAVALAVEWAIAGARPHEWPNGLNARTFFAQVVMVQNLTQTFGSYASSWSITNEVFYYLFYGALAWWFAGRGARAAWAGLGACVAVAAACQCLYVTVGRNPYVYGTGMLFGLGMLWFQGALVALYGRDLIALPVVRRLASCWPVVLAAAVAWKTAALTPHGLYLISGWAFTLMVLDFLASPAQAPPADASRLRRGVVTALGLSSYPMYLFHGPLLMLAGSWLMRAGVVADWRATWGLLVVLGLTSGVLLGWFLERPVMDWRAAALRRLK